jgi:hypothetical protein
MDGIVLMEQKGLPLTSLFDELARIVCGYFAKSKPVFKLQATSYESLMSIFAIIHGMKQMVGSAAAVFRNWFVASCSDSRAVMIFAVLNNFLEVPRPGVEISFVSKMADVRGVITEVHPERLTFRCRREEYSLTSIRLPRCKLSTLVDLDCFDDLSVFIELFRKVDFNKKHLNVLKYASLLMFFRHRKTCSQFPKEFRKALLRMDYTKFLQPEEVFFRFFFYFSLFRRPASPFSFTSLRDQASSIQSGVMTSMSDRTDFISSPIHPRSGLSIDLTLLAGSGPVTIQIHATTRFDTITLQVPAMDIEPKSDEDVYVNITNVPESSFFQVTTSDSTVRFAVVPAVDMLYVIVNLTEDSLVEFEAHISEDYRRVDEYPADFSLMEINCRFMEMASRSSVYPIADSSIYNNAELIESSEFLLDSLLFLLRVELRTKLYRVLSPRMLFQVLLSVNPFPLDESLSLDSLKCNDCQAELLGKLKGRYFAVDHQELVAEFRRIGELYRRTLLRRSNQSCLFFTSGSAANLVNCFVISRSQYSILGFGRSDDILETGSLVIPFTNFFGTIVELVVTCRHFMILSMINHSYDFSVVSDLVTDITRKWPVLTELFHDVLELGHLVSEGSGDAAFLIRESIVHQQPENFLLPRYINLVVEPHWSKAQLPATFCLPNVSSVYLSIRSPESRFEVSERNQNHSITANSFVLLKSGEFAIRSDSELPESIEYIMCQNPDYEFASEVREWGSHHSHQLLLSIKKPFKRSTFKYCPLSARFSFETARFLYAILQNSKSRLFRFRSHLVRHEIDVDPSRRYSDSSGDSQSTSFNYCRDVADFSRVSVARTQFIKSRELNLFSLIDPDMVRISSPGVYANVVPRIRKQLKHAIRSMSTGNKVETWLLNCIRKMPHFVVVMFLELVLGKWTLRFSKDLDRICLFFVSTQETIEALPSHKALVLGQFQSEEAFRVKFMQTLQEFSDRRFRPLRL